MAEVHDLTVKTTIKTIKNSKNLKADQALALANQVAKAASAALSEAERERNFVRMEELAKLAESAYLLASEKVPPEDRDIVAFASTYWSLRADHAHLDAQLAGKAPFQRAPMASDTTRPKELSEVLKRSRATERSSESAAEDASTGSGLRDTIFKGAKLVGAAVAVAAAYNALRESQEREAAANSADAKPEEQQGPANQVAGTSGDKARPTTEGVPDV